jgi:DNA-directed RNA polymerase subunit M/transcription elongation factor TFIIS
MAYRLERRTSSIRSYPSSLLRPPLSTGKEETPLNESTLMNPRQEIISGVGRRLASMFCDRCGTFLKRTSKGMTCPRCGYVDEVSVIEVKRARNPAERSVYVVKEVVDAPVANQTCPSCGHNEAYRAVVSTQGEHAGVKQDRALERYTCTKCHHSWTRN